MINLYDVYFLTFLPLYFLRESVDLSKNDDCIILCSNVEPTFRLRTTLEGTSHFFTIRNSSQHSGDNVEIVILNKNYYTV